MKEPCLVDPSLLDESIEDLYEHATCGYLTYSDRGVILKMNQTLLRWIQFDRSEIVGKRTFQDLLTFGSKVFLQTHINPLVTMQGIANEIYFDLAGKAGLRVPVLTSILRKSTPDGSSHVYKMTLFNIADRKKYESELIKERNNAHKAAEAKADFLSMMSHEIRTPMNAVIGIANLLESTPLSHQQVEYLDLLKSSAENLMDLLNSILDFSKIESGKDHLDLKPVALKSVVWGSVRSIEGKARQKKVPIGVRFEGEPPPGILTDPIKLGQILNNLLGNAVKFTDKGRVDLLVRCLDRSSSRCRLKFEITDTGIGISEDRLQTIFGEFSQADSEISLKYGGSGLGLAISSKLTELLGGQLGVTSRKGHGSTFSFALNFSVAEKIEEASLPQHRNGETSELRDTRILIAEDNAANVFILERLLKAWGVTFQVVGNGQEVLDRLQAETFDILLLDLHMPIMDGFETARRVRERERNQVEKTSILAFSASSQSDSDLTGKLADFDDSIGKPFRPEELYQKLLKHRRQSSIQPGESSVIRPADAGTERVSTANDSLFTLDVYLESLDDDREAVYEIILLVIDSLRQSEKVFMSLQDQGVEADFEFQAHRIQASLEMLKARPMQRAIVEARAALRDKDLRSPKITQLCHELDRLCIELKASVSQS